MFEQRRRSRDDLSASMRLSARLDSGGKGGRAPADLSSSAVQGCVLWRAGPSVEDVVGSRQQRQAFFDARLDHCIGSVHAGGGSTQGKPAAVQGAKSDPQLQAIAESVSSDEDESRDSSSAASKGTSPAAQPAAAPSSGGPSAAKGSLYRSVTIQNTPAPSSALAVGSAASQSASMPSPGLPSKELDALVPGAPAAAASAAAGPAQAAGTLSPFLSLQQVRVLPAVTVHRVSSPQGMIDLGQQATPLRLLAAARNLS